MCECECVVLVFTAGRPCVRAGAGESCRAQVHVQTRCSDQALAQTPQLAVLPLSAAGCQHHHVPLLLPGKHAWIPRSALSAAGV